MPIGPPEDICAKAYAVAAKRVEEASVVFQGNFDIGGLIDVLPLMFDISDWSNCR
jgi:hypothetical protein